MVIMFFFHFSPLHKVWLERYQSPTRVVGGSRSRTEPAAPAPSPVPIQRWLPSACNGGTAQGTGEVSSRLCHPQCATFLAASPSCLAPPYLDLAVKYKCARVWFFPHTKQIRTRNGLIGKSSNAKKHPRCPTRCGWARPFGPRVRGSRW